MKYFCNESNSSHGDTATGCIDNVLLVWHRGCGRSSDPSNWKAISYADALWQIWLEVVKDYPDRQRGMWSRLPMGQWRLEAFETRKQQLLKALDEGYPVSWRGLRFKRNEAIGPPIDS